MQTTGTAGGYDYERKPAVVSHERSEEVEEQIARLSEGLYLYRDFDIWPPLFRYLEEQVGRR